MSLRHRIIPLFPLAALLTACHYDPVSFEPTLTVSVTPATISVAQGTRDYVEVESVRTNSGATIVLSVNEGPAGVIVAFETINTHVGDVTTGTLTVIAAADAVPGTYHYVVRAANGHADDVSTPLAVTVTAAESQDMTSP